MKRILIAVSGLGTLALIVAAAAAGPEVHQVKYLTQPGPGAGLPFSAVVDTGDIVYLSGGLGLDPETGQAPEDVDREIRLLMDGVKSKLELAGLTMDDLVSVQIFCPDLSLYEKFNAAYRTYFTKNLPARAFIGSGPLLRGARFEITGIAHRP